MEEGKFLAEADTDKGREFNRPIERKKRTVRSRVPGVGAFKGKASKKQRCSRGRTRPVIAGNKPVAGVISRGRKEKGVK